MMRIDRRSILQLAALGSGALFLPGGRVLAQTLGAMRGFTHNVASGEPGPDRMLLWARFVGSGADARMRAEIAETPDFSRVITGGEVTTGPWRDWTAKVTVTGLMPGRRYYYRFIGPDGSVSAIGRTKTLPEGKVDRFAMAIFSCSNLPFGWFNAYGHAAARDDLDLAVHMGDYIYEYARGTYPSDQEAVRLAALEPANETIRLADYRLRYAAYRTDADLAALHARMPMIASMDDHESANDSWEGGAQNHQADEGDWMARKAAAIQAYYEWMPIAEQPWSCYRIGSLAQYYRTESRLLARSRQPEMTEILSQNADPAAALIAFKTGAWQDPARTMLGTAQEAWLASSMAASVRAGTVWQILGSGTNVADVFFPDESLGWIPPDADNRARQRTRAGIAATHAGLPGNFDSWGGYPAARARLLGAAQSAGANLIVVTGDSHNAWAFDLVQDGRAVGVECGGHSVSSPGFEHYTRGTPPDTVAKGLIGVSPGLKWADTSRRGYMRLDLTPTRATNAWIFMDTVAQRSQTASQSHLMTVLPGRNQFSS